MRMQISSGLALLVSRIKGWLCGRTAESLSSQLSYVLTRNGVAADHSFTSISHSSRSTEPWASQRQQDCSKATQQGHTFPPLHYHLLALQTSSSNYPLKGMCARWLLLPGQSMIQNPTAHIMTWDWTAPVSPESTLGTQAPRPTICIHSACSIQDPRGSYTYGHFSDAANTPLFPEKEYRVPVLCQTEI